MKYRKLRLFYLLAFLLIFTVELLIALFVRDRFIRPYGGDILVTVLLCCFLRVFLPTGVPLLPLWVFLFAAAVEFAQAADFVTLLGLGDSVFFSTLLGTTFSPADILCYGTGCLLFAGTEFLLRRKS